MLKYASNSCKKSFVDTPIAATKLSFLTLCFSKNIELPCDNAFPSPRYNLVIDGDCDELLVKAKLKNKSVFVGNPARKNKLRSDVYKTH